MRSWRAISLLERPCVISETISCSRRVSALLSGAWLRSEPMAATRLNSIPAMRGDQTSSLRMAQCIAVSKSGIEPSRETNPDTPASAQATTTCSMSETANGDDLQVGQCLAKGEQCRQTAWRPDVEQHHIGTGCGDIGGRYCQ